MPIRKLRAGRVPGVTRSQFIGQEGTIFWDESTGYLYLSDGVTPGGHDIGLPVASSTRLGGIKIGPGVELNNDGQIIIDSAGLDFNFGDFLATTPGNGAATLSSANTDQDINLVSNGTGVINMIGDFHIHRTADYDPEVPNDPSTAVFAVKADGQIQMKVPLSDVQTGALEIIGNDSGLFVSPNQTGVILHITGNSGLVSRNYFDANANYSLLVGRRYNGTQSAISKVLSGEMFFRIAGQASTDTGFETFGPCQIDWVATENQGPNNQGGELRFRATPNGVNSQTGGIIVATINATTGLTATKFNGPLTGNVTGNVTGKADTAGNADTVTNGVYTNGSYANPAWITSLAASKVGLGSVENTALSTWTGSSNITTVGTLTNLSIATGGTITTPRVVINDGGIRTVSGGTTCTIDFATDTYILWTAPSGTAAVTLQNYTAGARVKLMIALTTSRDVTYGISAAANSSTGADNWNGAGAGSVSIANTTIFLDYICMSSVAGGCYVAVTVQ